MKPLKIIEKESSTLTEERRWEGGSTRSTGTYYYEPCTIFVVGRRTFRSKEAAQSFIRRHCDAINWKKLRNRLKLARQKMVKAKKRLTRAEKAVNKLITLLRPYETT